MNFFDGRKYSSSFQCTAICAWVRFGAPEATRDLADFVGVDLRRAAAMAVVLLGYAKDERAMLGVKTRRTGLRVLEQAVAPAKMMLPAERGSQTAVFGDV